MAECPYWMLQEIRDDAPGTFGRWDIAPLPGRGGNWGGAVLAIPKQSRHVAEAWKFVDWYTRPAQQAALFRGNRLLPCGRPALSDLTVRSRTDTFISGAPVGELYADAVLALPVQHLGDQHNEIAQAVMDRLAEVEAGRSSPSAAWRAVLRDAQQAVDEQDT